MALAESVTRVFWSVAFIVGCVLIVAWVFQRRLIYYPARAPLAELSTLAAQSGFEPWLARDGRQIGWKTVSRGAGIPLLIIHGNAGHALHRASLVARLEQAGVSSSVFLLEYPGYGFRGGAPSESSLVAAGTEALDELGGAIVLGESLGTGVACAVAARRPDKIRGLILLTPFDSLAAIGKRHYPALPVGLLLRDRYDSVRALKSYQGPVVIIVAANDGIVPASHGRRLFDSYAGSKRLFAVPGSDHNEAAWDLSDESWRQALDFVRPEN